MSRPDGGPAFPYASRLPSGNIDTLKQYPGLSIRDYFAAVAFPTMLAWRKETLTAARDAYVAADAMLQARHAAGWEG